ncbi:MAG: hypothetical protein ACXVR1_03035 [Solirubrobacteraceae bacterium]
MSTSDQPSEDELRAAYEAEIKKIRVEQILLDQVVSLINLGMRRTGLSPGTEDERDLAQVRLSIDAVRSLLPLIEETAPPQAAPIRDALSQLQLAFVRLGGAAPSGSGEAGPGGDPGEGPGGAGPGEAPGGGGPGGPVGGPGGPAGGPGGQTPPAEPPKPGEPGPAQRSGRLWVPGQ